jgi:hypothetical protein
MRCDFHSTKDSPLGRRLRAVTPRLSLRAPSKCFGKRAGTHAVRFNVTRAHRKWELCEANVSPALPERIILDTTHCALVRSIQTTDSERMKNRPGSESSTDFNSRQHAFPKIRPSCADNASSVPSDRVLTRPMVNGARTESYRCDLS